MKKLTAILLALAMLFAFAACGGSTPDEDAVRGEQKVNTTQANDPAEDVTKAPSDETTNAPDNEVTDAPATDITEPEFSLGDITGLNYENEFIGIGCNLPADWTFYTDEQIKELNNVAADLAGEEYKEAMKNATVVYDMLAASPDMASNINVNLEKVDPILLAVTDLSDYLEQSIPMIKQGLENMGATVTKSEIGTVTIDGIAFDCLRITSNINGLTMCQLLFATKCNGYIANLAISTTSEVELQEIIDCFYIVR